MAGASSNERYGGRTGYAGPGVGGVSDAGFVPHVEDLDPFSSRYRQDFIQMIAD
jgi:hypothetical protein